MLTLSFSDFTLLALRLSICSPRSAMVLLCFSEGQQGCPRERCSAPPAQT